MIPTKTLSSFRLDSRAQVEVTIAVVKMDIIYHFGCHSCLLAYRENSTQSAQGHDGSKEAPEDE